jgi:hypothetical protein
MTPETTQHLNSVEGIMRKTFDKQDATTEPPGFCEATT